MSQAATALAMCVLLTGCVSTRHVQGEATHLGGVLAGEFVGRRAVLSAADEPSIIVDVLEIDEVAMRYRAGARDSIVSVPLASVCRLTPRPGGRTAHVGATLMGVGFGGIVLAGSRRDKLDSMGVAIASVVVTIAGLILSSRRGPETRASRYVFHNPHCDGSPERQ